MEENLDIKKYYDIIINIDSISKLFKEGWDIIFSEEGKKNYEIIRFKYSTVVGVIGLKNIGKTYISQKIFENKLPHGVSTKGINILFPKNMNYIMRM